MQQIQQPTSDQQTVKETTIFALSNDYYKCLLYFELDGTNDVKLNEIILKELLSSIESIQSIYVLHGNKRLLVVCKPDTNLNDAERLIIAVFEENKNENFHFLKRKSIPFCNNDSNQPLLLVAEVTDVQLKLLNADDKNTALKAIESKTGLKLKKVKKTFYFSGLLFQFVILNEFLNEKSSLNMVPLNLETKLEDNKNQTVVNEPTEIAQETKIKTDSNWHDLYIESTIRGHFMLKPKLVDDSDNNDFFYDVYIFEADLTDLNTDGIVNAANPNLHPGYIGDGISRRIREKAGKQMQDACKRIIRQDRNNILLRDGEVVFTKSYGKLKSKYVLHTVVPTWTKYVTNLTGSSNESSPSVSLSSPSSSSSSSSSSSNYKQQVNNESGEKFETLLEQSFNNLFKQAHDTKLQLTSLAIPVMSTSLGGAFDIPLDLCAHILYTQLVDFKLTADLNKNLKTICITSLETNTVKTLCDIFSNYTECYSESTWALPLSPISRLLTIALEEKQQQQQQPAVNEQKENLDKYSSSLEEQNEPEIKSESEKLSENIHELKNLKVTILQPDRKLNNTSNVNSSRIVSLNEVDKNDDHHKNSSSLITIKTNDQRHPRTLSNSSSNSSSLTNNQENNYFKQLDTTRNRHVNNSANLNDGAECLFCQNYYRNYNKLVSCGSQNCAAVFCPGCISNYLMNQKTQKCPSCRLNIDKNILNSFRDKHTPSIAPVHERLNFNNTNFDNSSNYHSYRYAITDARVYVKVLDDSCEGYEKFRTLIVTFEIDDGIQNDNHPKPGKPFKGTSKRAYLPEIREHRDILAFYERALKSGRLFRIAYNNHYEDYRVHLNQDVLLKTSQRGGGRFGYPDSNYIKDLLHMARNFK